jgi:hypothetical protein
MLSNLWNLIPLNIRLVIYAFFALIIVSGGVFVSYKLHEYDKVKKDNIALQNQVKLQADYLDELLKTQVKIQKGRKDASNKIKQTPSSIVTPKPLLDTINGLQFNPNASE